LKRSAFRPKALRPAVLALLAAGLAGCATGGPRHSSDVDARLRVASVAEAAGQPEVALSVLATLANSNPDDAGIQARYVRALARTGNLTEAEAAGTRMLQRHPGNPALLRALGQIRLIEGKPAEALENFRAVLRAEPRDVGAATGQGIALDLLGQHDGAQASYRSALATDPQNLAALNNLAMSHVLTDRPGEAVGMLEPLTRRSDATDRVRNNLSAARAAAGMAAPPVPPDQAMAPPPIAAAPAPRAPRARP
jgi:Flp pilus assembly protein TadD